MLRGVDIIDVIHFHEKLKPRKQSEENVATRVEENEICSPSAYIQTYQNAISVYQAFFKHFSYFNFRQSTLWVSHQANDKRKKIFYRKLR